MGSMGQLKSYKTVHLSRALHVAAMTSAQTHSAQMHLAQTQAKNCEGTFSGSHALKLFYQSWYPSTPNDSARLDPGASEVASHASIKGVLALVHGLGEHSGRYCTLITALTAAGYAVFAYDNQGHGRSQGQRGHIDRWQDYRNNTQTFLQLVRQQEPDAPLFLMGHSLGGLIVLDYVLSSAGCPQFQAFNLRGMIVSAPPIQPTSGTAKPIRILLARLLSGLFPRFTLKMGLEKCGLSRNPEVVEAAAEDPLTHPYVTLRWGSETLKTIEWVKAHVSQLRLPILLTHGEADPIIAPEGSRQIFQQMQSKDKTLRLYPDSFHEPHNDLDADVVASDLVGWLDKALQKAGN